PYLELNNVLNNGVFYAANLLYGISFKERKDIPVYQPDVKVYEVFDKDGKSLALFYTTSKLGDVQSFNNGLILTRTEERIHGIEATVDYLTDDEKWGTGGTFTWMKGRERPDNGQWRD
ncbi:M3 family metallopeptidase, partial [Klebsiella pneumoniae]|uniref:M3 family metallopeptidase n=1 Tax=Klebsiella pneumoniae TaxID=573 RepID=UPI002175F409